MFINVATDAKRFYILLGKESHNNPKIPKLVTPILEEFRDLLHRVYHLLRIYNIKIDLVPCSTLSNQPCYYMSPTEHKKLRCQVEYLLKKRIYS